MDTLTGALNPSLPHYHWWLALASPMVRNSKCCDWLHIPICRVNTIEDRKKVLDDWWGTNTREELLQVIQKLALGEIHANGDGISFDRCECSTPSEWESYLESTGNEELLHTRKFHEVSLRILGRARFLGFDYVRATTLIRWGHFIEWISDEELAFLLSFVANNVQQGFDNWNQYLNSYILGRSWWAYTADDSEKAGSLLAKGNTTNNLNYQQYFSAMQSEGLPNFDDIPFYTKLPVLSAPDSLLRALNIHNQEAE